MGCYEVGGYFWEIENCRLIWGIGGGVLSGGVLQGGMLWHGTLCGEVMSWVCVTGREFRDDGRCYMEYITTYIPASLNYTICPLL